MSLPCSKAHDMTALFRAKKRKCRIQNHVTLLKLAPRKWQLFTRKILFCMQLYGGIVLN